MADKNVYFFKISLISNNDDNICSNEELEKEFNNILANHTFENNNIKIIDITEKSDTLHTTADHITTTDSSVFMRLCKQKIRAGFTARDYMNNTTSNILPGNNESENGIEICTYAYINFELGILELVGTQTAANERFLNKFFTKYKNNYYVELLPIPNPHSLDALYNCKNPQIKTLDMEVPIPNIKVLSESLGWSDSEIESLILNNNLKVSICLQPVDNNRGSFICDTEDSRKLIDIIKSKGRKIYNKAKLSAKENNDNLRTYDFFDDNFGFKINVRDHHIDNGNIISHTADQLLKSYTSEMTKLYNENYIYFTKYIKR
jgi:hypothetical protein